MAKLSKLFLGLLIFVLLVSSLVGCSNPADQQPENGNADGDGTDTVRVGAILPLSGAVAPVGLDSRHGIEFAMELVNGEFPELSIPGAKEAGLPNLGGAKMEVIFSDHQAQPETGMGEAERLITTEDVVALVGCYNSAVTATASQAAERYSIPFVNPDSVSPPLIERGFKWFFRVTADDVMFAENFFQFLDEFQEKENVELKTVGILWENSLWGTEASQIQRDLAEANGYEVVADIGYSAQSTDLTSETQRLAHANPDILIQNSYISDAILYLKTFEQMNWMPKFLLANGGGFSDTVFIPTLQYRADYTINRVMWAKDFAESRPLVKEVNDLFKERYGNDMNEISARSFTAFTVLADAINRAGSTDPEAIREALLATDFTEEEIVMPWQGVKFADNGQNILATASLVQVQDQEYYTIWPFEFATKDVVFPIPGWQDR